MVLLEKSYRLKSCNFTVIGPPTDISCEFIQKHPWTAASVLSLIKLLVLSGNFCVGFYVIKDYEPKLSLVISKLLLWRVVHIYNFIKDVLHHGRSPYNFVNYSEFLENLWAGLRYRAFKLCAFIVLFTVCFQFYIFRTLKT